MKENHFLKKPFPPGKFNGETDESFASKERTPIQGDYLPDEETAHAVNLALELEVPLLITGEPGVGKTSLADCVAERLGWGSEENKGKALRFQVKSESEAKDVLYYYDALERLYDAQHQDSEKKEPGDYIRLEALGKAIKEAKEKKRNVVLIDEIDKAPNDFPNGLLMELDEWKLEIRETGEKVQLEEKDPRPLVIITSNSERQLPDPFLRRCLVHEIPMPDEDRMFMIMKQRLIGQLEEEELLKKAIETFYRIREKEFLIKPPSSADLLLWLRSLAINKITLQELNVPLGNIPNKLALLKHKEDIEAIKKEVS